MSIATVQVMLFKQAIMRGGGLSDQEASEIIQEALERCPDQINMTILDRYIRQVYVEREHVPYWPSV